MHSGEEARAYLQTRLALFAKLMFWSFTALIAFLGLMYLRYPYVAPPNNNIIFAGAASGLLLMGVLWRQLLVRRTLSVVALHRLDFIFGVGIGSVFAMSATLANHMHSAAYASLLYAAFTMFTRAIVVPSSGTRSAVVSIALFTPMMASGVYLGVTTTQELPGPAFVAGAILFGGVAILLAHTGSRILYGLRRQVSEAMQLGQYTLDRKIGEGGMGAVYHARHALLRRPTAVKLLLPNRIGADTLDRFEREVQHMSQLTHPNTVAVFDYGRSPDGVLYYAMEYLDGLDLAELVQRFGPQPSDRVVQILAQVCGALQEAHDAGLIHRDIKPANIILCSRGGFPDVAKVVDFGLVKELTRDQTASTQIILGTPGYIAPENITDPAQITPAADLYSLGAVAYYLLTGKRIFEGKTAVEICIKHVTSPVPKPSEVMATHVDPALEAIVMRCLEKAPADRYASARDLAEALEARPRANDWDRPRALEFWRTLPPRPVLPPTTTDAITVTIDIGHRT